MKTSRRQKRSGFSLIELLVVIAIITLLASLIAFTLPNIMSSANDAATKATIKKVNELLNKRLHAISREIIDQEAQTAAGSPPYRAPFEGSPLTLDQKKVLGAKDFLRKHCPQTFSDGIGEWPASVGDFSGGSTPELAARAESAEALLIFLLQGKQFDAAPVDTDTFRSTELADTDGDGYMEIVDAWSRPLRFYRWPTRLIRPDTTSTAPEPDTPATVGTVHQGVGGTTYTLPINPDFGDTVAGISARVLIATVNPDAEAAPPGDFAAENSVPLSKDPDDPLGVTVNRTAPVSADIDQFEHDFHTPDTWHTPLIVSAGRDGVLGLFEPSDTTRHGYLAQPDLRDDRNGLGTFPFLNGLLDNLTNRQE